MGILAGGGELPLRVARAAIAAGRPVFAAVISIAITLIGAIAGFRLPISEYPEVVPPTVVVRAVYPGEVQ